MTPAAGRPRHLLAAQVARVLVTRVLAHRTSLAAAGCAFYATLALFPALAMLVSIYGLVFDIGTVAPQLETLKAFLPPPAYTMIAQELGVLVSHRSSSLSLGVAISALFTVWSATTGTGSLMTALNFAYDAEERRSTLRVQITAAAMTLLAVIGAVLGLALMVALPAAARGLGIPGDTRTLIHLASLALTAGFVAAVLSALYRFGPSHRPTGRRHVLPGALAATAGWMAATALFSTYVAQVARFDATYGPLAAVAGIMLWFWVSAFAALAGGELNAVLEREVSGSGRPADSTDRPPSVAASAPPGS
ncbi:MAG: YihY/virulence factor BrkB family protein [Rhodospirillales bacterium]|nr:YihY/virulence factor BrkB family protein [Rhodospirillales bacterium]